ncbi:hypothetical protein [Rhizobium sp. 18065]|uniref:hypothetical protein n=1 Tax=Rhizobium sp. 18065 TaxID=2681411 RepID=UPI001359621A|nr:hypothetical protein [Rhizobium sp. 18065]
MRLIEKNERYEIWEVREDWGFDYIVYGVYNSGDPRVCPSLAMAREVAAGA